MITAPKDCHGINVFKHFLEEIPLKRAAKILAVTERTIWRWLSTGKVPKAAVLALYWETSYGRSLIDADHINEIQYMRRQNVLLLDQLNRARDIISGLRSLHAGTANQPLYEIWTCEPENPSSNVKQSATG